MLKMHPSQWQIQASIQKGSVMCVWKFLQATPISGDLLKDLTLMWEADSTKTRVPLMTPVTTMIDLPMTYLKGDFNGNHWNPSTFTTASWAELLMHMTKAHEGVKVIKHDRGRRFQHSAQNDPLLFHTPVLPSLSSLLFPYSLEVPT
jgi:hypothetical protein